jgi:hypothetical protein
MVDAVEEARFLWKLFDENPLTKEKGLMKLAGVGMEAWDGNELVKKHGAVVPKLSDFRVCVSPVVLGSKPDAGGSSAANNRKRNRRAG